MKSRELTIEMGTQPFVTRSTFDYRVPAIDAPRASFIPQSGVRSHRELTI